MTTFNTDYNNTELLDQELSFDELQEINGGLGPLALLMPIIAIALGVNEINKKNR